jgi:hypothetical protein
VDGAVRHPYPVCQMKNTRRQFLAQSAAASLGVLALPGCVSTSSSPVTRPVTKQPWYRRTFRWGQTNITEADPPGYDIGWWRDYWKRTRTQGVIINAGGIVAYYPSELPLQHRATGLGDRDLFGELLKAAHSDGLVVLARMDSNRAHDALYNAHPDWFAVDDSGRPRKAGELFVACVNSPYYTEYLPEILREIGRKYRPEGFADNSWSGLGRQDICFCENCRESFRKSTGKELPKKKAWDDANYRQWIVWNYARRLELWDLNNQIARDTVGEDCLWIGMNSGSITGQAQSFRDYRGICARAELILLDHQARGPNQSLSENADAGQLIHSLFGWNKLVAESMAMYQTGGPTFRKSSKPEPEARLWMLEGIAGGLQPWWHHVGAAQEDRRQFQIAESVYHWHETNQEFLVNREPVSTVGLVWSQRNTDFFGRDQPRELVELPWRGWAEALTRSRIPYLPIHIDDLDEKTKNLAVLVLANIGALSDSQIASIKRFSEKGGAIIATGRTSLYDEWGQPRRDFGMAGMLGCHYVGLGREGERPRENFGETVHTYLRIEPGAVMKNRSLVYQPVLEGFEQTDILPFGGWLGDVIASDKTEVPLTFIPAFPVYPPETAWMRESHTKIPGLILNATAETGRTAFLVADIDRRFGTDSLPDHGRLLSNLARWAARDRFPFYVEGPGKLDCRLYRQENRLILHLINLTSAGAGHGPVDELIPVGPITVRINLSEGLALRNVRLLVGGSVVRFSSEHGRVRFQLPSVLDHEVAVIS